MRALTIFTIIVAAVACFATAQPQTLSPQTKTEGVRPVIVRQRAFSDAYGGVYRELMGPQGRRVAIVMDKYGGNKDEPFRMAAGPDVAASMGILSPQEVAELEPPKSLADQLVTLLEAHGLKGMETISKIGFTGDAGTRWREALEVSEMTPDQIDTALALVDALIAKAQNDAKLLTSSAATKPLPVAAKPVKKTPAVAASKSTTKPKPATAPALAAKTDVPVEPLPTPTQPSTAPVKPTQPIDATSAVLPDAGDVPLGWSAAEVIKPEQLRAGDIVFVYSPYQFVLYQDPMSVSAVLPSPPTFWRMGVVFRVEGDTKRFGLSMDYVQSRNMRTVWTVVGFNECIEVRRFGSIPYNVK